MITIRPLKRLPLLPVERSRLRCVPYKLGRFLLVWWSLPPPPQSIVPSYTEAEKDCCREAISGMGAASEHHITKENVPSS